MCVIWSQNIYCNYTCLESSFENMQIRLHIAQCNYICLMAWPHLLQAIKEKLKIGSPTGQISGEKIMQSSIFVNVVKLLVWQHHRRMDLHTSMATADTITSQVVKYYPLQ